MLTGSPYRALTNFFPDPARPAPAFSIVPTDREPGTGYNHAADATSRYPFQSVQRMLSLLEHPAPLTSQS